MRSDLEKDIATLRDFINREETMRFRVFQRQPEKLRAKVQDCRNAKSALRNLEAFVEKLAPDEQMALF